MLCNGSKVNDSIEIVHEISYEETKRESKVNDLDWISLFVAGDDWFFFNRIPL